MPKVGQTVEVKPSNRKVVDPWALIHKIWPDIYLYDKQREILYSVWENDETVVPAGNMLGKDYIAGLTVLSFFLSRHPCRIVTTSVDGTQLNAVLWGEIRRFLQTASIPLTSEDGGPLIVNNLHIRKIVKGERCGLSYILGRVASDTGEGMLGHHIANVGDGIPRTLFVPDEASGVPHAYYDKADTWAQRKLIIGNPFECQNFFKWGVIGQPGSPDPGGDLPRTSGVGYFRKIVHICAEDSPNVQLGILQEKAGKEPTDEVLVPGVKTYSRYKKERLLWDKIKQTVCLDGKFYQGAEILMFPPQWLDRAAEIANQLHGRPRVAKAMGIDTAAGGDNSAWCVVDELGILELYSIQTPNTAQIVKLTTALAAKHDLDAENILFDAGGGGKEHADYLREHHNLNVRTVGFGETTHLENKFKKMKTYSERREEKEEKVRYKNRRIEMYDLIRQYLSPELNPIGFGIPAEYYELRKQLAPIPRLYDGEGKMYLPPKRKKPDSTSKEMCLVDIIGRSPDDADALALALFGLVNQDMPTIAGALRM